MTSHPPAVLGKEFIWLRDHPEFEQRPASIVEFLGPNYLDVIQFTRPMLLKILVEMFGKESNPNRIAKYTEALFTGAIGVGKTTIASLVVTYMTHWLLCLKDPQGYFNLMPGSRIALMQMSTSEDQAKEVVFGDISARINNSPWFKRNYLPDPKFKSQFHFPKDIWIIPGDSAETTFEGYNIIGGVLDEADSHRVTKNKDYAEQGHSTIYGRMTSRFGNRGFLIVIGQMKHPNGFVAKTLLRMSKDPTCYVSRITIWESLGWSQFTNPTTGERDSFWYDTHRFEFTTKELAQFKGFPDHIIEVPNAYRKNFLISPHKAMRDLAGRPPSIESPFFHDPSKLELARDAWCIRYNRNDGPVDHLNQIADWFVATDSLKRTVHVDIAFADEGDALGLAMGHVPEMVEVDGEWKPYICIDLIMRIKAPPGQEIILSDVRRIIYKLRSELHFRITKVTTDGFESTDFRQQMRKHRIGTDVVSMDRSKLGYQDLHDAMYEERLAIPPYMVALNASDPTLIDILYREISNLQDIGPKIDHPPDGSKDVSDSVAGVTTTLMGSESYHNRGGVPLVMSGASGSSGGTTGSQMATNWPSHPAVNAGFKPQQFPPLQPLTWRPPTRK